MIRILIDNRPAEFRIDPFESTSSEFRVRVFRGRFLIGNGSTIANAENDVNNRIRKLWERNS